MEKNITKIMEDPFLKQLSKENKNKTIANDLKMLKHELNTLEGYLNFSVNLCKKLNSNHIENVEHLVGMIKFEIEGTSDQVDRKLKYWNRFATI